MTNNEKAPDTGAYIDLNRFAWRVLALALADTIGMAVAVSALIKHIS